MLEPEVTAALFGLIGSGIGAGLTALVSRRKLRADAAEAITQAASQIVELQGETITDLRARVSKLERQHGADRQAQVLHTGWDHIARERLKDAGIDVPEPPPLYAPEVA